MARMSLCGSLLRWQPNLKPLVSFEGRLSTGTAIGCDFEGTSVVCVNWLESHSLGGAAPVLKK